MAVAQTLAQASTPEDYLALELESEERHEYINGEIRSMTGGTPNHNDIAGNIYILLKLALKGKAYRTFYADQRLWIPESNLYTYPDVMVVEMPLQFQINRTDTLVNPCLIVEVLSKSTQDYDHGEKFSAYRTIEPFCEYLLVDQYTIHVEHYVKVGDNKWLLSEFKDPDTTISLKAVKLDIQIVNLYEGIDFSEPS